MPNKNYIKGRNKEYKIMHKLKDEGCIIAHRTAGSHSPIDVFGINKEKREIIFIQSKPDNFAKSKKEEIENELNFLNGDFKVRFELI